MTISEAKDLKPGDLLRCISKDHPVAFLVVVAKDDDLVWIEVSAADWRLPRGRRQWRAANRRGFSTSNEMNVPLWSDVERIA
jgi:hypothetical protein